MENNFFFIKKEEIEEKNRMLIYEGGEIIKKYPFVKQRTIKDCGPACVQMILKYYGGYLSLDKLSIMLNTNQNGTSAWNIKEVFKSLNFKCYGIKSKDISTLNLPCIAHLKLNDSYKHYVVIYKVNIKRKTLLIADPAIGLKKISFTEFKKNWTNVTVQMRPNGHVISEGEPQILSFLLDQIKRNKIIIIKSYIISVILSLLSVFTSLFLPVVIGTINTVYITPILLLFSLLFLFKNIFDYFKNYFLLKLNLQLDQDLSQDIFKKALNLPYRYYRRKTSSEIISYFNDIYIVEDAINQFIQKVLIDTPLILILFLILISIFKPVIFLFIFYVLILVLIIFYNHKKRILIISNILNEKIYCHSYITENILGYETIKNLNIPSKIYSKFKKIKQKQVKSNQKLLKEEKIKFIQNSIDVAMQIMIVILLLKSNVNINNFITVYVLSVSLMTYIKNIINSDYQISEIKASLNNIAELFAYKSENKKRLTPNNNIYIKDLNYTFDKENYVLKNINLKIPNKSKILVTGDSGSGKSTLFKIIKGYYDDYIGSVTIGKKEVNKYDIQNIIYISQKEILFTGTLKDNLSLKKLNKKAFEICEINDITRNDYYLIEEDGYNLSGGQKQRIVLARALNQFKTLIIDEGLNQVSVDMERRILKKILKKYKSKTIIYISHRLDNLDLFDRYIKMHKGKIILDEKRNN